jgi:transposase
MTDAAPQREHRLRDVFNGLRWIVRARAAWRMMPNDLPPWNAVYEQARLFLLHIGAVLAAPAGPLLRLSLAEREKRKRANKSRSVAVRRLLNKYEKWRRLGFTREQAEDEVVKHYRETSRIKDNRQVGLVLSAFKKKIEG